jgi:hypothetical protein
MDFNFLLAGTIIYFGSSGTGSFAWAAMDIFLSLSRRIYSWGIWSSPAGGPPDRMAEYQVMAAVPVAALLV